MCENFPNIRVTEGNAFALLFPLRTRTYVSSQPIDEDIDYTLLENIVFTFGGVEYAAEVTERGVKSNLPDTLAIGTYNAILTAKYLGISIRAAYESAVTIVPWSEQSSAEQYIVGSPIVMRAAYVLSGAMTDAELEELKEEYREKNSQLEQAIADAEEAKREWEEKAADIDGVAQEETLTQGVQDIRDDISHIDIDTSTLAKQGTNPNATLSEVQRMIGELWSNQEAIAECYEIAQEKGLTIPAPTQQTLQNLPAVMEEITPAYNGRVHITLGNNIRAITNSIDITEAECIGVIFHLPFNSTYAFGNLQYIRKIKNLTGVAYCINTLFNNSPNLEWVDMVGLDCSNVIGDESLTAAWINTNANNKLKTLVGDRTYEEVVNNNISILTGLKADIKLIYAWTYALNHATIRAIINGLGDLTGDTAKTITLGVYMNMLTQEEIEIATNKNWNVIA